MSQTKSSINWLPGNNFAPATIISKQQTAVSFFKVTDLREFFPETSQEKVGYSANSYGMIWIKNGAGILKVDMNSYPIEKNMLLYFTPGQLMQMDADRSTNGYLVSFSGDFLLLSDKQVSNAFAETSFSEKQSLIYPEVDIKNELEDIIGKMQKENASGNPLRKQILSGLLTVFILYLSSRQEVVKQDRIPDRDRDMVRKFMSLVKSNFLTKKMVTDYASELCVSPNYLNRIVKKISGFTASHHIQQCIITEAKRQALYSDMSMKEVAYSLGFNDYAHFSKFFKNNSGTNFSCFKSSML